MSDPNTIEIETLRELISGFFDYFVPKGGVSVVPRGPFSRAIEHMGGCENCGGDPFQHKDWCEEPTPYDDIVEDGGLPEAREAAAAWTPDPKPVESAVRKPEEVFYKDEISINGVGGSWEEVQRVLRSWELEIRAERDAYWRGQLDITKREALEFSRAQGDANRELRRRLAEVLGNEDE